ncbi:MAG: GLPGLI family protein [Bacteroidales bacterium]|jgi:GLPGLI family protein|nr:GLPGLI family protein [Bacteroidales bacterium]
MKRKKIFTTVLLFYCVTNLLGQTIVPSKLINEYNVLDTSIIRVAYSLDIINNIEKPLDITNDIIYLEIGDKLSKSYSYTLFSYDSIATVQYYKGAKAFPLCQKTILPMEVFKNYLQGQNTIIYRSPFDGPIYLYLDDYCKFNWNISSDLKEILGYQCQKATSNFRGRIWEAWFTNEIPISDGPWNFCGLPGLILAISDSEQHYSFTCIGIENTKVQIVMWDWIYEKTIREKLNKYLINFHNNPYSYMQSTLRVSGKSEAELKKYSFPYNPIELE